MVKRLLLGITLAAALAVGVGFAQQSSSVNHQSDQSAQISNEAAFSYTPSYMAMGVDDIVAD